MTDRGAAYWASVGDAWSRRHPQRLWRAHSDAENRALLKRWLPSGCRRALKTDAFDEAFGEGLVDALRERAAETWMIDLSATVLAEAQNHHPTTRTAAADVRRLPFPAGSFDVVVSISTLDHFDDAADIEVSLRELHRVLEPGGCLVVTLDNPENPAVGLRNSLPWIWLHRIRLVPYYVGTTLDRRRLVEALEGVGFEVTGVDAIQHIPRVLAVASGRLVAGLGWDRAERTFLKTIAGFERLRRWRSRYRTGYFVAVRALRR